MESMHFHHIFIFSKVRRTSDITSPTFDTWSLDVRILHFNPYDVGTTYIGSSQILMTQKIKMNVILLNIIDTHFGIRRHHKSDVKNGMRQGIGALAHL